MAMDRREWLREVDVRAVVQSLGVSVVQDDGTWLSCRCPLPSHGGEDKNPSFRICTEENGRHEKGFWKCHKEGLSGSIYDLIIELGHAGSFREACEWLKVDIPKQSGRARKAKPKIRSSRVSEEVIETRQTALFENERIMDYLLNVRGLREDVIKAAALGFEPQPFGSIAVPYRAQDGEWRNCKLITWPKPSRGSSTPRAMFTEKGGWQGLYVPIPLEKGSPVVVVESEMDCLLLWSLGQQAIATGGTAKVSYRGLKELTDLGFKLLVYADTDEAGQKAVRNFKIELFKLTEDGSVSPPEVQFLVPQHSKGKDFGDQFVYLFTGDAQRDAEVARGMLGEWLTQRASDSLQIEAETVSIQEVMDRDSDGEPKKTQRNLRVILSNHSRFQGKLWLDAMGERIMWDDRPMKDTDVTRAQEWIESDFGLTYGIDPVFRKMQDVAESNRRHLVQEYLSGLRWDGEKRIMDIAGEVIELKNEEQIELKKTYVKRWLVSAVARAMQPGCKADAMLVLVGDQGLGKSTFGRSLVGSDWFSDQEANIESKDYLAEVHRRWIVEVSELDATTRRKDVAQLRGFISRQYDAVRLPYARTATEMQRSFVFLGTTNHQSVVREENGRRYWPILVKRIDFEWVAENRDQIWAEAVALYEAGEKWWLTDEENDLRVTDTTDSFSEVDPALEVLRDWVEQKPPGSTWRIADVLVELNEHGLSRAHNQVGSLLRKLGCSPKRIHTGSYRNQRGWGLD